MAKKRDCRYLLCGVLESGAKEAKCTVQEASHTYKTRNRALEIKIISRSFPWTMNASQFLISWFAFASRIDIAKLDNNPRCMIFVHFALLLLFLWVVDGWEFVAFGCRKRWLKGVVCIIIRPSSLLK